MSDASRKICKELTGICARVVCVIVLLIQGGLINYYLVQYVNDSQNLNWLGWIAADVVNCVIFIITLVVSYLVTHVEKKAGNRRDEKLFMGFVPFEGNKLVGELPMGYIAWCIYSVLLVIRLAIFFKTGAAKLNEENFFGPNMMKTAIGLSAFVFFFLVSSSSSAKPHTERAVYLEKLIGSTTLDILDSVEFLEILFIQESKIFLTFHLWNSILAFSCINLFLPTIPLLVLSHTRFGQTHARRWVKLVHTLLFLGLINGPFLIIRLYLWHVLERDISVFIIKNAIMLMLGFVEIFNIGEEVIDKVDGASGREPEEIEMGEEKEPRQ